MKPLREYTNTFPICGRTLELNTRIYCEPSDLSLEDLGLDDSLREELERDLETGALMLADLIVTVSYEGFEASDSIGACFIRSPNDVETVLVDHALEFNAREALETELRAKFEVLKRIFETKEQV